MDKGQKEKVLSEEGKEKKKQDVTGRDRFFSNLLYSWGGYLVVFVAGFISPRLIDRSLGQIELGIWDFSWSFVSYMNLAMLGIGSSIGRYVAIYRAAGDSARLNRMVSTVVCLQATIAILVLVISVFLTWITPYFFSHQLGEHTGTAQWTVMLLGASLAVHMVFDTSRGVITGCHRWDLHNKIEATTNILELIAIVAVLYFGGGLRSLGTVVLSVALLSGLWRMLISRNVCPGLHVRPALFHWNTVQETVRFGLKSLVIRSPFLILVQTTSILIVSHLGPASLAVFSRSMALVRHVENFISKFAYILAPTAGSLQGLGREDELRLFFLETTRYGIAFAAPMLFFLIIDGDLVLRLWMGEHYVHGPVLTILALGYFLPTSQNSVREILKGLNAHGKIGLFTFCTSCACFLVGLILLMQVGWSLFGAAILLAFSLGLGIGVAPAVYACNKLKISYVQYWRKSLLPPLLCNTVFIGSLIACRWLFPNSALAAAGVGGAVGMFLLILLYMRFIFPNKSKALLNAFRQRNRKAG